MSVNNRTKPHLCSTDPANLITHQLYYCQKEKWGGHCDYASIANGTYNVFGEASGENFR